MHAKHLLRWSLVCVRALTSSPFREKLRYGKIRAGQKSTPFSFSVMPTKFISAHWFMHPITESSISLIRGMDTPTGVTPWWHFTWVSFGPRSPRSSPVQKQNTNIASSKRNCWHAQTNQNKAQELKVS